jgi:hypothetical protein
MNAPDPLDAWVRARREQNPPDGFPDRVMGRIREAASSPATPAAPRRGGRRLFADFTAAAVVLLAGMAFGALRGGVWVLFLLLTPETGG